MAIEKLKIKKGTKEVEVYTTAAVDQKLIAAGNTSISDVKLTKGTDDTKVTLKHTISDANVVDGSISVQPDATDGGHLKVTLKPDGASEKVDYVFNVGLNDSKVVPGTYGSNETQSPSFGGSFLTPYVTVDKKGIVTAAGTANVNMPSLPDTANHDYYIASVKGAGTAVADATKHESVNFVVGANGGVGVTPNVTGHSIAIDHAIPTGASASGQTKTSSTGYVSGLTVSTDKFGHVTGLTITEGTKPSFDDKYIADVKTKVGTTETTVVSASSGGNDGGIKFVQGTNITLTPDATNHTITIASKDTVYTHPTYTAHDLGLYKIANDATGHVSNAVAVKKEDITALGIPGQDTTYTASKGVKIDTTDGKRDIELNVYDKTKDDDARKVLGLGDAAYKGVDATVTASSTNLPTSAAVATYVGNIKTDLEGKIAGTCEFLGTFTTLDGLKTLTTKASKGDFARYIGTTNLVLTKGTAGDVVHDKVDMTMHPGDLVIALVDKPAAATGQYFDVVHTDQTSLQSDLDSISTRVTNLEDRLTWSYTKAGVASTFEDADTVEIDF